MKCKKEGSGDFVDPRTPGENYFKCRESAIIATVPCGSERFNDERDKVCQDAPKILKKIY